MPQRPKSFASSRGTTTQASLHSPSGHATIDEKDGSADALAPRAHWQTEEAHLRLDRIFIRDELRILRLKLPGLYHLNQASLVLFFDLHLYDDVALSRAVAASLPVAPSQGHPDSFPAKAPHSQPSSGASPQRATFSWSPPCSPSSDAYFVDPSAAAAKTSATSSGGPISHGITADDSS